MIEDLAGTKILDTGWAGPLFWITTEDGCSIHLYDAPIKMEGEEIGINDNSILNVKGKAILEIEVKIESFSVKIVGGLNISVESRNYETARVFIKNSKKPHHVYSSGKIVKE